MAPKKTKTPKPTKKFADRKPPRLLKKPIRVGTMQEDAPQETQKKQYAKAAVQKPQKGHAALKPYRPHDYLYGVHAVGAALQNPRRKCKILITSLSKQNEYQHLAEESDLKVIALSNEEISHILPQGAVHQGVALISSPLPHYDDISDISANSQNTIMVLDGVTDPHNVGAILRVCAAFGCKSLIMQDRSAPQITGALAKSAAGATEIVDIIRVKNIARTLRDLKNKGYMIYGADGGSETSLPEVNFAKKSVIIMGSEGSGMRRLVREECDTIISIPMAPDMESLNVSVASGILLGQVYFGHLKEGG